MKKSRARSFLIILLTYVMATVIGIVYNICGSLWEIKGIIPRVFIADTVATLFVWLVGVRFRNSSVYDPYWSVAPPVIMTILVFRLNLFSGNAFPGALILILTAVWTWSVRLTANWAYTFKDLGNRLRYTKFHDDFPGSGTDQFLWDTPYAYPDRFLAMLPAHGPGKDAYCSRKSDRHQRRDGHRLYHFN